ncbi:aminotransferase class IV [Corynebacterium sanguinis]|uniref:Aminotransferase class IV n=1 Tax=Corynebacterium sanguinis TaxID=2594913 RepID=A0A838WPX1_9CORY|nr:aminotransferase class IV [Corynebacterium sanguinis]MBA4504302.1 aminotransferase class IV [Corynebacterium sanguinis]MCT1413156.1 aminotransferase class IV [Corynebacterium sanguinis]MCT1462674.1 aminotransferase class IV [Corynebacterium sanguinis]MCT1555438.1 aminotransferase class IV [Corynebacterium sanguinis]MCT1613014.1 aminotransferase class IV [Corynebacterium sanguinis]
MTSYVWQGRWVPTRDTPQGFDCADSWRHEYGRARGLELHRMRFAAGAGPLPAGMWENALALLDASSDLFPRISVYEERFRLDIRPAPPVRETTDLTLVSAPDPRTMPLLKGPDLMRLAEHRRAHAIAGTDDVILGDFAETTTGTLVGWNGRTLVLPEATRLPSTTEALVVERGKKLGCDVAHGVLDPAKPMWFLNALHGISPVRRIVSHTAVVLLPRSPGESEWRSWWRYKQLDF